MSANFFLTFYFLRIKLYGIGNELRDADSFINHEYMPDLRKMEQVKERNV